MGEHEQDRKDISVRDSGGGMQDLGELREIPPLRQGRMQEQESMDRIKIDRGRRMKLSEMRNKVTGLPDGFAGVKVPALPQTFFLTRRINGAMNAGR